MKPKSIALSALMILCCIGFAIAQSGYLKLGEIEGEATADGHKDWIIIESVSMGISQRASSSGAIRQRAGAVVEDFMVVKKVDKSSPKLMEACAMGKVIPKLELEMTASNGRTYYKVTLERVIVSSVSTSSAGDGSVLVEEVAFNYAKITWEYTARNGSKTSASYDVQRGN